MRVLVAFDKFKDALTAPEACEIAAAALRKKHPAWELDLCPLCDGGDGFAQILTEAAGGKLEKHPVTGPRGGLVHADLGFITKSQIPESARQHLDLPGSPDDRLAIVEMASASGLALLAPGQRNPWETTSRGTGQLLRAAKDAGARAILLGVGGSATHDLGLGALTALGFEFLDNTGKPLRPPVPSRWGDLMRMEGSLPPDFPALHIACDVNNPLLGPQGAAAVFAPQKGLHPDELNALEEASEAMAHLLCTQCRQPLTLPGMPGAGAAGGLAFGLLCAARARLVPGFTLVADWLNLAPRIAQADLVLTGEGSFDSSSLGGKGPGAILTRALTARKPVRLFAGRITSATTHDLLSLHEITPPDIPLERALRDASLHLEHALQSVL